MDLGDSGVTVDVSSAVSHMALGGLPAKMLGHAKWLNQFRIQCSLSENCAFNRERFWHLRSSSRLSLSDTRAFTVSERCFEGAIVGTSTGAS
mmetsp:Transcript_65573/g.173688  ORF Transcript_65573/g.173688 Transcript_65573/m.173688 type:complete len:92 (+) Transcript_65573:268-543(+)